MAKLRLPFTKDGTVTAGNSSGVNDSAAAVLMMSREKANELGLKAKLAGSSAVAGVDLVLWDTVQYPQQKNY